MNRATFKKTVFVGSLWLMPFSVVSAETQPSPSLFGDSSVVTSTTSNVTSSVTSLTGSFNTDIDKMLGNLDLFDGGLSSVFNQFDVGNIESSVLGDNELMQCLVGDMDLDLDLPSGICSLTGIGSDIFGDGMARCAFKDQSTLTSLNNSLRNLCKTPDVSNVFGGDDSVTPDSWNNSTGTYSKPTNYSSGMVRTTTASSTADIGEGTKVKDDNIGTVKLPSGKTLEEAEGKNGGAIARMAKEKPNSSTAKAYRELDVPTLEMKKLAYANNPNPDDEKALDESLFRLPATPLDAIKVENEFAKMQSEFYMDLNELQNYIVKNVRQEYLNIKADTLSEYYKKEKEVFRDFTLNNEEISKKKIALFASIQDKYALIQFNEKGKEGYLPDISEERARMIHVEKRNKYRFNSVLQMNENSLIKGRLAIEKKEWAEAINRTVERAYSASSIFRGDIAKKEIDEMLKAVDSAIR